MKNYPEHIEEKIGFDQIRQKISAYCFGPKGKEMAAKAGFSNRFESVELWLAQTGEWLRILEEELGMPEGRYLDIAKSLDKLRIEGYFLFEEEFLELKWVLKTIDGLTRFFNQHSEDFPQLQALIAHIPPQRPLIQAIDAVIDDEGRMRSNASPLLQQINSLISDIEREVQKRARSLYKKAKDQGWTADTELSVREGRIVIPIVSEHKRKLKGIVHDESGSGQILYIEPTEIIEMNNELRELQLERRREIERILRELTAKIAPEAESIRNYNNRLGVLDFIRAKALFARSISAQVPVLKKAMQIRWIKAFHPLLLLHHRQSGLDTIPLSVELNEDHRLLVISGPNAGGKSVAMKSIGLLQYMVQCGIPVPASPDSYTCIFKQLFIDIGDEQSLDNDLSTYSSHLTNMKHFVELANGKTMVLIDEFGTGTDPQFGGPMAEAILESLNRKKVYGVVTTHYSNLKLMADKVEGLQNAAMAYDTAKLQPLYRLETGKPGSSFALEVAAKIGLPEQIISRARKKVGHKQQNLDDLLLDLEKERKEMEEKLAKAAAEEQHYMRLKEEYASLKENLESRKKDILQQAREEAYQLLKNSNSLVEKTIREIKEAGKEVKKNKRQELSDTRQKLEKEVKEGRKVLEPSNEPLEVGAQVRLRGQTSTGVIIELQSKKATVEFGEMRTQVDITRLERVNRKTARELKRQAGGFDTVKEMQQFNMDIDVRGQRGEEAVQSVISFLDRAIILGFDKLRVIHGIGDGILRKLIRQQLKGFPQIEKMEDEHIDRGGQGVTLVYLK